MASETAKRSFRVIPAVYASPHPIDMHTKKKLFLFCTCFLTSLVPYVSCSHFREYFRSIKHHFYDLLYCRSLVSSISSHSSQVPNKHARELSTSSRHCIVILHHVFVAQVPLPPSLLRRGSSFRYINPLCEVYRRRKVEWIDQAENLCQMYVDFSYILVHRWISRLWLNLTA